MTEVEKKSGIYESNDGNDMIVDGKNYPITIPVANWLRDKKYAAGLNVTFEIKEQNGRTVVTKVYPTPAGKPAAEPTKEELDRSREEHNATAAKMKTAGFGQPTPGPAPGAPAGNTDLKTVEGQIVLIDPAAHKITLKDRQGAQHTFVWPPAMHDKMSNLKQWWFAKLTGEHQKDVDIWKLTGQDFFKRPDDWPAPSHGGGGRPPFQPRNERIITEQSAARLAADVWMYCQTNGKDYKAAMSEIEAAGIALSKAWCNDAGVQP